MCGILFSLGDQPESWDALQQLNTSRGPDAQHLIKSQVFSQSLQFYSTVLHLRGPQIVEQPIQRNGSVLCWNGEIFGGIQVEFGENDTLVLMDKLEQCSCDTDILSVLSEIEGPFAFVYFDASQNKIWFGRDCLGRRSLLWQQSETSFILSSVASTDLGAWQEVPANGFYAINLNLPYEENGLPNPNNHHITLYPWKYHPMESKLQYLKESNELTFPFPRLNPTVPHSLPLLENNGDENVVPEIDSDMNKAIDEFTSVLSESVKIRVADVPYLGCKQDARVAVLFSGGLDCICLAAFVDQHLPITEPIDLLNVAFENPRVQKAKAPAKTEKKNKKKNKGTQYPLQEEEIKKETKEAESKRSMYDTPDRLTGRQGVEELRRISPKRTWNFVEINVPYPEALEQRQHIIDKMYPLDTVMDLSIAMAFWFASRGRGVLNINNEEVPYQSHARVLLSGLGADEQLGGYSRHREAYRHGSWEKLIEETQLDVDRISTRNLGRDDRIMSDHGKEVRFPFLSTYVVQWLCQQPIQLKMDLRYARGIGEKILLRHVARQLGLVNASQNWKRAIQFGAKTAKMTGETRLEKGQHKLS